MSLSTLKREPFRQTRAMARWLVELSRSAAEEIDACFHRVIFAVRTPSLEGIFAALCLTILSRSEEHTV